MALYGIIVILAIVAVYGFFYRKEEKARKLQSEAEQRKRQREKADAEKRLQADLDTINAYRKQDGKQPFEQYPYFNPAYFGQKDISLKVLPGFSQYPMAGMFYRNMPLSVIGRFNGCAQALERDNFEKYPIGVFNGKGLLIGYLPKKQKELYQFIRRHGGKVPAYGILAFGMGATRWYGQVCVAATEQAATSAPPLFEEDYYYGKTLRELAAAD